MKLIYHTVVDYGETDLFFEEDGTLLHAWCGNDANYRAEFMDPLFAALGIEVAEMEFHACGCPLTQEQVYDACADFYGVPYDDIADAEL